MTNPSLVKLSLFIKTLHDVRSLVAFFPESRVLLRVYLGKVNCYQVVLYGATGHFRFLERATAFNSIDELQRVFNKYRQLEGAALTLVDNSSRQRQKP